MIAALLAVLFALLAHHPMPTAAAVAPSSERPGVVVHAPRADQAPPIPILRPGPGGVVDDHGAQPTEAPAAPSAEPTSGVELWDSPWMCNDPVDCPHE